MANYYVATAANGGSDSNDGSSSFPWLTFSHACEQVSAGAHTINIAAGVFWESSRCDLKAGVNVVGLGTTLTIIMGAYSPPGNEASYGTALISLNSTAGVSTDGNQSLSYFRLDGNSQACTRAIAVTYRNNVEFHHLSVLNFKWTAFVLSGTTNGYPDLSSTYHSTGNSIHDCYVSQCSQTEDGSGGNGMYGHVLCEGQDNLDVYNNTFDQTGYTANYSGDTFNMIYIKNSKIHDNILYRNNETTQWNFYSEILFTEGGLEIYNNVFNGIACLDLVDIRPGTSGFGCKIYGNTFTSTAQGAPNAHGMQAIDFEDRGAIQGVYIYGNYFKNCNTCIQFDTDTDLTDHYLIGGNVRVEDIYIYYNLFENVGNTSNAWSPAIVLKPAGSTTNCIYDDIYVDNNTIISGTTYPGYAGVLVETTTNMTNILIRNNIIQGFSQAPIMFSYNIGSTTIDGSTFYIQKNLYYNNDTDAVIYSGVTVNSINFSNVTPDNPDFVSATDFHLSSTSPAIDAGLHITSPIHYDVDLDNYIVGTTPDIGAFEYGSYESSDVPPESSDILPSYDSYEIPSESALPSFDIEESAYIPVQYDLKYQSDFYNAPPFEKKVSVKLYKKDYGTHSTIYIRTSEVIIEVNYQEDTPIIGTGAKIGIINAGAFDSLEDLLTTTEKEFKCVIEYNNQIVFEGYSICDLNEQQFLPNAKITLQFTDYLHRLDSAYLDTLKPIGVDSNVFDILQETVKLIGSDYTLYVNSTLFETRMNQVAGDTFLEQTFVENNMFYSDAINYDNAYDALNKVFKSFGIYLYTFGDKFIMERWDDITRIGNWVAFTNIVDDFSSGMFGGVSTSSLKTEYNKQDGDFNYVEESQIVEYNSGLETLIIDLKDNQLDTFVFNDWTKEMLKVNYLCTELNQIVNTLALRTWYMYATNDIREIGFGHRGMEKFIKWAGYLSTDPDDQSREFRTLNYVFRVTVNESEEVPTVLSISYKQSGDLDLTPIQTVRTRFTLMVDSGAHAGDYIAQIDGPTANSKIWALTATPTAIETNFDVSISGNKEKTWSVSAEINLTDMQATPQGGGLPDAASPSLWQQLGNTTSIRFIISFLPADYTFKGNPPPITGIYPEFINYIGDVQVAITQQQILNKLTYNINKKFIKTKTVDLDFFDLENENFSNGPMLEIAGAKTKTKFWETYQYTTHIPLYDIFARVQFGNYCRTMHKLKGTILFDGHLKPFSILTDDNLIIDGTVIKLILQGYTWDLNNGKYEIEATEYIETAEEPGFNATDIPGIPSGLTVSQPQAGEHMAVSWTAVTDAVGYRLQRMPYSYNPGYYNNSWFTIYIGEVNSFNDDLQNEPAYALLPNLSTIYYKVSAYNSYGESIACAIVSGTWYR